MHAKAKAAVEELGGLVVEELPPSPIVALSHTKITDRDLICLKGFPKIGALFLSDTRVTDAGLAHLQGFDGPIILHLSGTRVTDAGLARLKELTLLESLDLSNTRVTDVGLVSPLTIPAINSEHAWRTTDAFFDSSKSIQRGGHTGDCIPAMTP